MEVFRAFSLAGLVAAGASIAPLVQWQSSNWKKHNVSFPASEWDFSRVVTFMEQGSRELGDTGMSGIIYDSEGTEVWRHTAGKYYCTGTEDFGSSCSTYSDDWTADTMHPIFSGTKVLSAATFMMSVVEPGLASLDVPFSSAMADLYSQNASGRRATPRMVMSHTSGMLGLLETYTHTNCFTSDTQTLEECVKEVIAMPLQHEEGTQFEYSDFSWEVLGLLMERVTGRTLEQNFRKHIADPLGMDNSTYECPEVKSRSDRAHPAIGLCISVSDLGKFVQMMHRGGLAPDGTRVVSSRAIVEIYGRQTGDALLYGDELNYFGLVPSRCTTGDVGVPSDFHFLDYGFGVNHYLGFKSESRMHMGSWGVLHWVAPGRYAAVFSNAYPSVQPPLDRHLRCLDAFEQDNFPELDMCPTTTTIGGGFFVKDPVAVPWVKHSVVV